MTNLQSIYITLTSVNQILKNSFELSGNWEVGIKEISYKNPELIPIDQNIYLVYFDKTDPDKYKEQTSDILIIPQGNYNIDSLVDLINDKITKIDISKLIKIETDQQGIRPPKLNIEGKDVYMDAGHYNGNGNLYLRFDNLLADRIGFPEVDLMKFIKAKYNSYPIEEPVPNESLVESFSLKPYNLNVPKYIIIDSNINKNSYIGENVTPLLGVVGISPAIRLGTQINKYYEHPIYYPMKSFNTDNIILEAVDNYGKKFNFQDFYITLHLRKRQ